LVAKLKRARVDGGKNKNIEHWKEKENLLAK
jgi:hypothetical protein